MAKSRLTVEAITEAAMDHGIPPALALAVWEQESGRGTNPRARKAVPHAGDPDRFGSVRGEFQVLDSTFKKYFPRGNPDDPIENMLAGVKELASAYKKSGGDVESTLAVYHSGSPGIIKSDGSLKRDSLGKMTGAYIKDVTNLMGKLTSKMPTLAAVNPEPIFGVNDEGDPLSTMPAAAPMPSMESEDGLDEIEMFLSQPFAPVHESIPSVYNKELENFDNTVSDSLLAQQELDSELRRMLTEIEEEDAV